MDVFVIPIGRDRYELYCEVPIVTLDAEAEATSWFGRLRRRVEVMLHAAEHRHQHGRAEDDPVPTSVAGRLQERALGWIVERIAEQRLLWNLRREDAAVLVHPEDMTFEQVMTLMRDCLRHDYDRHRRWVILDGILFVVTFVLLGPLFLLSPGVANLPALYFGFRVVGHYLSKRGAWQGLHRVSWTGRACPPLRELRDLVPLETTEREARVHDIAARLRLQHLSAFFERVAVRHA